MSTIPEPKDRPLPGYITYTKNDLPEITEDWIWDHIFAEVGE